MDKKTIDLEVLPDDAKRELIDFYEYLVRKYGKKKRVEEFLAFVEKHRIELPKDYKFDREEIHER